MSNAIVVPLNEMQQLAAQWRATVTEMDGMVQQIARDIAAIPDKGKGLNEVRSRGRTVGVHHQQLLTQGLVVQKHVLDSMQRFTQADQELAGMVRNVVAWKATELWNQLRGSGMPLMGTAITGVVQAAAVYDPNLILLNSIDTMLGIGKGLNGFSKLGIELIKRGMLPTLTEFMGKLNVWPTLSGLESSKNLATGLGGALTILTMAKDIYDARTAASEADAASARGDYELASKKYREAYDESLNTFATGTLAVVGILTGTGMVIIGAQVVSGVTGYAADYAAQHGHENIAQILKGISAVTDLKSHTKKLWDAGINAYMYPHEALKQVTNFVDSGVSTVKNAVSTLYEGAKTMANDLKNMATGWLPSWAT